MAEIADIKRILKSNIKVPSNRRIQQRKPLYPISYIHISFWNKHIYLL